MTHLPHDIACHVGYGDCNKSPKISEENIWYKKCLWTLSFERDEEFKAELIKLIVFSLN